MLSMEILQQGYNKIAIQEAKDNNISITHYAEIYQSTEKFDDIYNYLMENNLYIGTIKQFYSELDDICLQENFTVEDLITEEIRANRDALLKELDDNSDKEYKKYLH